MVEIPLFPLKTVLFPGAMLPLQIFEERYRLMIGRCLQEEAPFGVVLIRSGEEVGGPADPFDVGTTARITRSQRLDDGRLHIITVGRQRFRIQRTMHDQPYLTGVVELLSDEDEEAPGVAAAAERVRELFAEYMHVTLALNGEWIRNVGMPQRPGALADHVAARLAIDARTKQRLLEELSVPRRLAIEQRLLQNGVVLLRGRLQELRREKFGGFSAMN